MVLMTAPFFVFTLDFFFNCTHLQNDDDGRQNGNGSLKRSRTHEGEGKDKKRPRIAAAEKESKGFPRSSKDAAEGGGEGMGTAAAKKYKRLRQELVRLSVVGVVVVPVCRFSCVPFVFVLVDFFPLFFTFLS